MSGLVHMNSVQVVDFDMCRFGHADKGPMSMLMNSLLVAQKVNRRCPSRQQHPARETDMKIRDTTGWAAVPCKAIHPGTEDQIREDQDKTIANLMWDEFYDETTDEKLDKKEVAEARRQEMTTPMP